MATGYETERFESIPGNETSSPTYSTKRIYIPWISFNVKPGVKPMERDDEIRNLDEPLQILPESYQPEWEGEHRMYPDPLGWRLNHILGNPTTTAGNGVITDPDTVVIPVGAHRHVWTAPFGPTGPAPLTSYMQAAYRDQSVFFDVKGAACGQVALTTPETGGGRVQASGPALYVPKPVADPSLTPAYESLAIPPFERSHLTLPTWLAGSATSVEDVSVTITRALDPYASLGIASKWRDVMEKGDPPVLVTGSMPKRQLDADDINALMDATAFAAKIRWVNTAIIASGYPYKFFVEMSNAQYMDGGPNPLENKQRIGSDFAFKATTSGAAASCTITLVNATSSYS